MRDAAAVEEDRPRISEELFAVGLEERRIDAPGPHNDGPEASFGEFIAHRRRRRQCSLCRAMEPAHERLGPRSRHMKVPFKIERELGVIRRGDRESSPEAVPPATEAKRALGRDVNGIRIELGEQPPHAAAREQAEANLRVLRTWNRAEQLRVKDEEGVSSALKLVLDMLQCRDHPVDLRAPRVGDQRNSQRRLRTGAPSGTMYQALPKVPSIRNVHKWFTRHSGCAAFE